MIAKRFHLKFNNIYILEFILFVLLVFLAEIYTSTHVYNKETLQGPPTASDNCIINQSRNIHGDQDKAQAKYMYVYASFQDKKATVSLADRSVIL